MSEGAGRASPPVRLAFLDGMRGLACLNVAAYHAAYEPWVIASLTGPLRRVVKCLAYGHFAVGVFIVLSGYCLMLPVAASPSLQLKGGFAGFLKRRARRILPPYYAAVALALAVCAVPMMQVRLNTLWEGSYPAFAFGPIASHLALVQNLNDAWIYRIAGPLWSVATEWQIYLVFALVLLPVLRAAGVWAAVALAFALGLAPHVLGGGMLDKTAPWYLGLFALGMCAAMSTQRRIGPSVPPSALRIAVVALWLVVGVGALGLSKWWWGHMPVADTLVGLATAALILYCGERSREGHSASRVVRLMESRPVAGLGHFSYSVYLVHLPLISLIERLVIQARPSGSAYLALALFVILPCVVGCAYVFHILFERPFMSTGGRGSAPSGG